MVHAKNVNQDAKLVMTKLIFVICVKMDLREKEDGVQNYRLIQALVQEVISFNSKQKNVLKDSV